MKKFLMSVIVLALIGAGIYALVNFLPESTSSDLVMIRTDEAAVRDLESVVVATGEVRPLLSSIVKSENSGRITVVHVVEGQAVAKDELLLELDRTSLEAKKAEAERSVEAERLRLEKAERNFNRLKELFEKEFVGEKEYLDAETDYSLAKLNLEIAQTRLEDALDDLSKTSIVAPHDGLVTKLDVLEGEVISGATSVSNGTELLTIAQMSELFMEANINEVDVEMLEIGKSARLQFDAIPGYSLGGRIDKIAVSARKDGNVRVFPVEIVFKADDGRVRPGISATVEVPVESVDGVVSVLISGVFRRDDTSHVYVKQSDGQWERRIVETGINNLQYVEIKSGLAEGEQIALRRPPEFKDDV